MAITFDKKALVKSKNIIDNGKKTYAIKTSIVVAIFQTVFVSIFLFLIIKNDINMIKFLLLLIVLFIVHFIIGYYRDLKNWERIKSNYEETIEYFKKNNPDFIKDILETKETDDK